MAELTREDILINTGVIKPELAKRYINYFCGAVEYEMRVDGDLVKACKCVENKIRDYSVGSENIKTVHSYDDVMDYFFNQKKLIPGHIGFWLYQVYHCLLGAPRDYNKKHTETYNKLQRAYIERHRRLKQNDREDFWQTQQDRRGICRLYKSGEYADIFALCGKSFKEMIDMSKLENTYTLFSNLLVKEMNGFNREVEFAAGYMLGKAQGERMAAANI